MSKIYNCNCDACYNRIFKQCPTKIELLIENLEKEIKQKQRELNQLKMTSTQSKIWVEYAPDNVKI